MGISFPKLTGPTDDNSIRSWLINAFADITRFWNKMVQHVHDGTLGDLDKVNHANLTGLSTGDPHTQYLKLLGRLAGQVAYGDTADGGVLELGSTSSAVKGSIRLGAAGSPGSILIGEGSGSLTATGILTATGGLYTQTDLRLRENGGTHWYIFTPGVIAPASDLNFTLPTGFPAASGAPLVSTTAGVMSFATAAALKTYCGYYTANDNVSLGTIAGTEITLVTALKIKESGAGTHNYIIQGGVLTAPADCTYTLPVALPGTSGMLLACSDVGVLSWAAALTSALTSAHLLVGNVSNIATDVAVSGDLTMDNAGAFTIGAEKVTYAKMQHVSATLRVLGRIAAGAGDVEELTGANINTITGNGMVLIATATAANSATLDFTSIGNTTYKGYIIVATSILPATNAQYMLMRVSTGGTFDATAGRYGYQLFRITSAGSGVEGANLGGAATAIVISSASETTPNNTVQSFTINTSDMGDASYLKQFRIDTNFYGIGSGTWMHLNGGGVFNLTTAVDGFRFFMSSGNITSGTIKLYGLL